MLSPRFCLRKFANSNASFFVPTTTGVMVVLLVPVWVRLLLSLFPRLSTLRYSLPISGEIILSSRLVKANWFIVVVVVFLLLILSCFLSCSACLVLWVGTGAWLYFACWSKILSSKSQFASRSCNVLDQSESREFCLFFSQPIKFEYLGRTGTRECLMRQKIVSQTIACP